jgi:hypothetical protein
VFSYDKRLRSAPGLHSRSILNAPPALLSLTSISVSLGRGYDECSLPSTLYCCGAWWWWQAHLLSHEQIVEHLQKLGHLIPRRHHHQSIQLLTLCTKTTARRRYVFSPLLHQALAVWTVFAA